jgi:hypothetical protein
MFCQIYVCDVYKKMCQKIIGQFLVLNLIGRNKSLIKSTPAGRSCDEGSTFAGAAAGSAAFAAEAAAREARAAPHPAAAGGLGLLGRHSGPDVLLLHDLSVGALHSHDGEPLLLLLHHRHLLRI